MSEHEQIKEMADRIKEKLRGGTLFGKPIDIEDLDMMIVAADSVARFEELKDSLGAMALMRSATGVMVG